jgi:hypothetical protein
MFKTFLAAVVLLVVAHTYADNLPPKSRGERNCDKILEYREMAIKEAIKRCEKDANGEKCKVDEGKKVCKLVSGETCRTSPLDIASLNPKVTTDLHWTVMDKQLEVGLVIADSQGWYKPMTDKDWYPALSKDDEQFFNRCAKVKDVLASLKKDRCDEFPQAREDGIKNAIKKCEDAYASSSDKTCFLIRNDDTFPMAVNKKAFDKMKKEDEDLFSETGHEVTSMPEADFYHWAFTSKEQEFYESCPKYKEALERKKAIPNFSELGYGSPARRNGRATRTR